MAVSNGIRDSIEGMLEMPTLFGRHLTEDVSYQEIPIWVFLGNAPKRENKRFTPMAYQLIFASATRFPVPKQFVAKRYRNTEANLHNGLKQ